MGLTSSGMQDKMEVRAYNEHFMPLIDLPDEQPAVFDAFVQWMYTGKLQATGGLSPLYLFICQIYVFGDKWAIPKLCNAAIDIFHSQLRVDAGKLPYDIVDYVYKNTTKRSSLRDFLIDAVIFIGDRDALED